MTDLRAVLRHIMSVLIETTNFIESVHQFERVICITIDGRSAQWHSLDRMADPNTVPGGCEYPRRRSARSRP